jgi:hypothetical protein
MLHVLPSPLFEKEYKEVYLPLERYLLSTNICKFKKCFTSDLIYLSFTPTSGRKKRVKRKQTIETKWPLQLRRSFCSPGSSFRPFFSFCFPFPIFGILRFRHQSRYNSFGARNPEPPQRNRIYARAEPKTIIDRVFADAQQIQRWFTLGNITWRTSRTTNMRASTTHPSVGLFSSRSTVKS